MAAKPAADKTAADVAAAIQERYRARTQRSRQADRRAKSFLPGGDTRSSSYYLPYPVYMREGCGCYLHDCDDNEYLDFFNNATSLIHGHCHPNIVSAARKQLQKGSVLGSPDTSTIEHAALLCDRIPSVESVRYCNSGTEATLFAIRAARAFTGRDVIIKMDGGYHGTHDFVEVGISSDPEADGGTRGHLDSAGVPAVVLDYTWVVPFNDTETLQALLQEEGTKVAAVIMEPMPARPGYLSPAPGYLEGVRRLTEQHGILLIFDEVQTFRLSMGGFQALEGIQPDLTALGKLIGGGFPVGAFGGRKDIMAQFDPADPEGLRQAGTFNANPMTMAAGLRQAGTFNANPMTMAAGLAALNSYDATAAARVNALGDTLRRGFGRVLASSGIQGQATGFGSLVAIQRRGGEIRTARDAAIGASAAGELPKLLHLEMLNRGVFAASGGKFCCSTPMTDREIDLTTEAFESALHVLKPYVTERLPYLMKRRPL